MVEDRLIVVFAGDDGDLVPGPGMVDTLVDMFAVFRDSFAAASTAGRDEIDVEFPTSSWRTARARLEPWASAS